MQLCAGCGRHLDAVEENQKWHPLCTPDHVKLPGTPMSPFEMVLKEELLEILHYGSAESPRSRQVVLGCSEVGSDCDRRIAYRIVGTPPVNFPDPLKSSMGTAFHTWLDARTMEFQQAKGIDRWITETEVFPADFLKGHVDLYDRKHRTVLDWKTTSADQIKIWRKEGIPHHYKVQIMLYGKGMINAGYPVERVGLIGINRSGAIRDILVLTLAYDEEFALSALRRTWNIGKTVSENADFAKISSSPSRLCGWCPFYRGGSAPADAKGCPGKTSGDPVTDLFQ